MNNKEKITISLRCTKEEKKRIKIIAALLDKNISDTLVEAFNYFEKSVK